MNELVVATVLRVEEHPGARAPSMLVVLDVGPRGTQELVVPTGDYEAADLEGAQLVCRLEADGPVAVGVHSHGKGFVLLRPDRPVEPGSVVA